jgi:hypothetical protein
MPGQIQQHWLSPMGSNADNPTILLAIELSASTWLVAARVPGLEKPHLHRIDGGDTAALLALISSLRPVLLADSTRR